MKCSICKGTLSTSVVTLTTYVGLTRTITLCRPCQDKLWGAGNTDRVQRVAREAGWTQDRLPAF